MPVGPLLVRGSGSIDAVARLIRLVHAGAGDEGVLVLTTTEHRAAALRVALRRTPTGGRPLRVETCQAYARRLLREMDPRYWRGLRLIDATERRAVMRDVLRGLGIPATSAAIEHSLHALSRMKTQMGGEVVSAFAAEQQLELLSRYDRALQARRVVDPDDLPSRPLRLLRHDPARLTEARGRTGILVADEYTRLSPIEADLVTLVARENRGPIAVFSLLDADRVERFHHDFPSAVEMALPIERLPSAVAPSGAVSASAARRRVLASWPSGEEHLVCYQANDEVDEAGFVAAEVGRLFRSGMRPADIAVSYRLEATGIALAEAFRQASIPVRRAGWSADDETGTDVDAYLRLVAGHDDDVAFRRALARPPKGVPAGAMASLSQLAGSLKLSLAGTIPHAALLSSLPARTRVALRLFRTQLARWRELKDTLGLVEMIDLLLDESGYLTWARRRRAVRVLDGQIEELRRAAAEFERLEGRSWARFVDAVSASGPATDEAVRLVPWSRLLARDYAVVFLTGLEDGAVPDESALADALVLDAERSSFDERTRHARACTFLTYALVRTMEGKQVVRDPSRFLRELPTLQPVPA